ncbi:LmeA family phospholipid-binding protein [Mycobacterium vicinigordonae]|uniref:DUF2993 domain-containing protein n=1 Tax=Mycobacterium vicinigordonae TaxID=1719132 RepID=A0A7D6E9S3_9MYCO|nr:DUF2993 domain-containing protein [Mycobacterium vicinigordonae]QLL08165.1 DUF2993 domain-containing protein [Mycobacterium vicinigordonae]
MTTPQGPPNDPRWGRPGPGNQSPLGRPPAPGDNPTEQLRPGPGRPQQPPPGQPPPGEQSQPGQPATAASAYGQRSPDPIPPKQASAATTPLTTPKDEGEKRKRRVIFGFAASYVVLILVIVLALLVSAAIGVELYIRNKATNKIAAATACVAQDQATARFGVTPLVTWQVITDHYTNISIETAGNNLRDAKGMKLQLNISDIRLDNTADSKGTIGSIDATVTWTTDGIRQTVQNSIPVVGDFVTSSVTTHPKDNTVELKGMVNDIVAKPSVVNGALKLQIVTFNTLFGKLPRELIQSSLDDYTTSLNKKLPLGIQADRVEVTDSGVVAHFSSHNATIPAGQTDPCFADL